jgi:hypothetical protein
VRKLKVVVEDELESVCGSVVCVLGGRHSCLYESCADCAFLHCVISAVGRRRAILSYHS